MIDKNIVKNIIIEYQHNILQRKLTLREETLDPMTNYVVVGVRRAGKSSLLFQDVIANVSAGLVSANGFLYINFEDERLYGFAMSDFEPLLDCYRELYPSATPWIYLDEVQLVDGWEHFARRIADEGYKVRITGSNAKMLSREMASTLGGRYVPRQIWPFSFSEYLRHQGIVPNATWRHDKQQLATIRNAFDDYFHHGGFVEGFGRQDHREWIDSLYKKILLGDVIERNAVRNARAFRTMSRKLAESVMQPLSQSRLHNILLSTGEKISLPIMKDYLDYMENAYLVFSIEDMSSAIVERTTTCKRYFVDNGLLSLFPSTSDATLMENLVAIHLMQGNAHAYDALQYYNHNVEIDFCLPGRKLAIQVALNLDARSTKSREIRALDTFLSANPDWDALIVTLDNECTLSTSNGRTIPVVPIWKWLLNEM